MKNTKKTKATASKVCTIPLPEHPRPDWDRAEWLNLNGEWDFGFADGVLDRKITVPFGWGSKLSGVEDGGDNGFYRREITIPREWKGKRVFVVVGAADHDTVCSFAGKEIGKNIGGYVPFEFELTDFVKWGDKQPLEFKIWDPDNKTARESHYLFGKQGYGNVRGIWQTVYLEARGGYYLDYARFVPHIASSIVSVELALDRAPAATLRGAIEIAGKKTAFAFVPGERIAKLSIPVDNPHLWTLDDPFLYDVDITVGDFASGAQDKVHSYFGFREIGTGKSPNGDSYVTLNGKPIYLQLTLDQSYTPDGFYTFPTDEYMKNEIMISKKLGLSGNRIHIKIEVPRKLYWADKLGLLIQADVPNAWGDCSMEMFAEHWDAFSRMVKRDFNHPSIYQWTLFNETWGLFSNRSLAMGLAAGNGGSERKYQKWAQDEVEKAYWNAKELDPTRLVEDNSACNHDHVATDVNTWHWYRPGYDWERAVRLMSESTYIGGNTNYVAGKKQTGIVQMNSECGNVWGYSGSTGDCDFSWDYHQMINSFRRHLDCAGWLYTEHHDVINEWNGYVRADRTWKETGFEELAGMSLSELHKDVAIFFAGTYGCETGEIVQRGQWCGIPVGVSMTTDRYAGRKLTLGCTAWYFDAEGKRHEQNLDVDYAVDACSWMCGLAWPFFGFAAPEAAAAGCLVFTLKADGEEIARNFWSFATKGEGTDIIEAPAKSEWSDGAVDVLGGLKLNGFGEGFMEFTLDAPAKGGTFRGEFSAKRKNGKDYEVEENCGIDRMLGGGAYDRSKNANSYPQTSEVKFPANIKVYAGGKLVKKMTLPDDPADSRGLISWLSQPHDFQLREAGSYGYLVEAKIPASAVKDGKANIRIVSDNGLAVYGRAFGRYPLAPHIA